MNTQSTVSHHPYSAYKPATSNPGATRWDAIVVGSGMGGLGCAAALAKLGRRVLLLEQHYIPGGFAQTFSRKGFTWDVGVHCVGEMGPRDLPGRLLAWLTDGKAEMAPIGRAYDTAYFPDGTVFEFPDDRREFKRRLEQAFPKEQAAIDAYFALIRKVVKSARPYLLLRTLPPLAERVGLKVFHAKIDCWARTTDSVLS